MYRPHALIDRIIYKDSPIAISVRSRIGSRSPPDKRPIDIVPAFVAPVTCESKGSGPETGDPPAAKRMISSVFLSFVSALTHTAVGDRKTGGLHDAFHVLLDTEALLARTRSVPVIDAMTGQPIPGDPSMIAIGTSLSA